MKFSKNISCNDCSIKCDVFSVLSKLENGMSIINPLHVFYKKHEYICKQDSKVTHAIYLVKGSAKLYIEGLSHRNICLNILKPKSYIGLLSFFESLKYAYSVKAIEDTHVCMIDINIIKKLYLQNHDFLLKLNGEFGKSVATIMQKIVTLNQKNIRGRLADSLLYLSRLYDSEDFQMLLTRKDLGELAAISEENAVRLLSEFKQEGIISVEGRNISIKDKKLLQKISEVG